MEYSHIFPKMIENYNITTENDYFDIFICNGLFIELKLGEIFIYIKNINPKLKKSGLFIFDYIDISTSKGWNYLVEQHTILPNCYTYHHRVTIEKTLYENGFNIKESMQHGKSTYIIAIKDPDSVQ